MPRVWAADIPKLCPVQLVSLEAQSDGKGGDTSQVVGLCGRLGSLPCMPR